MSKKINKNSIFSKLNYYKKEVIFGDLNKIKIDIPTYLNSYHIKFKKKVYLCKKRLP